MNIDEYEQAAYAEEEPSAFDVVEASYPIDMKLWFMTQRDILDCIANGTFKISLDGDSSCVQPILNQESGKFDRYRVVNLEHAFSLNVHFERFEPGCCTPTLVSYCKHCDSEGWFLNYGEVATGNDAAQRKIDAWFRCIERQRIFVHDDYLVSFWAVQTGNAHLLDQSYLFSEDGCNGVQLINGKPSRVNLSIDLQPKFIRDPDHGSTYPVDYGI